MNVITRRIISPDIHDWLRAGARHGIGLGLIVGCSFVGNWTVGRLGLLIPGSVFGLLLLLGLLASGAVPIRLVSAASGGFLLILPALFVPLYVGIFADLPFWRTQGALLIPFVIALNTVTLVVTWRLVRAKVA